MLVMKETAMKGIVLPWLLLTLLADVCLGGIVVVGGMSQQRTASPGEVYEGTILLKNSDQDPRTVKIYQTDYAFSADGETHYGQPGSAPRSNAGWISLSPQWVTVPGQGTAPIHYRIEVPNRLDLTGTYWSIVMVEPTVTTGPQMVSDEAGQAQIGVQTVLRYGIQIVTDVGETGTWDIRFQDKRLVENNGHKVLEMDVENIGERWLSPYLSVELYKADGTQAYRFEGQQLRIYPGCSVRHRVDLVDVREGKYKVLVLLDNKDEHIFGAQYELQVR
jgi:hypothetical protein